MLLRLLLQLGEKLDVGFRRYGDGVMLVEAEKIYLPEQTFVGTKSIQDLIKETITEGLPD